MKRNLSFTVLFSVLMVFYLNIGTTSAQNWEPTNGPFGGQVNCFAQNDTYIFAGIGGYVFGKGIFRSADNGANWTNVNNGLSNLNSGKHIAALTVSGAYLIASTGQGIYRSDNNGDTWTKCNTPINEGSPSVFATVGTTLFSGSFTGLMVSTDNGLNWTSKNDGFPSGIPSIWSLAFNGTYLYAGTDLQGVFRSNDEGVSWTEINTDLYIDGYTNSLAVIGNDIFAKTDIGVFRLLDNGNASAWTQEIADLPDIATSPSTMMVKGNDIYIGGNYGIYRSSAIGVMSWSPANGDLPVQQVQSLFLSGANIFAAIGRKGVYLSNDSSTTWTPVNHGLTALSTSRLIHGPGSQILASTYEGTVYKTDDAGANWFPMTDGNFHADAGPCYHGNSVFISGSGYVQRSDDNGATWVNLYNQFWLAANTGIASAFLSKGDTIFAGGGIANGICYSIDNGNTWITTSGIWNLDVLNPSVPTVITIVLKGTDMYAGTLNGVFKSVDNGLNWTSCSGLGDIPVGVIAIHGEDIFAGTQGLLSQAGVFHSSDNGTTWTQVINGLSGLEVKALAFSGTDLYAGTTAGGIFKTTDNGATWTAHNQGFSTPPNSTSLLVDGNYIYTANWLVGQSVNRCALSGATPVLPSVINGSASPCIGSSQTYSVTNETGVTYAWQFPAGWVITAGGTTSSVTVTVGSTPGIVLVTPSNGWGPGPAQYQAVTVNAIPSTPVISQLGGVFTSDAQTGNQWYLNDTLIEGATSDSLEITSNGTYYSIVTINGCSSGPSNSMTILNLGIDTQTAAKFELFPVPSNGLFNATITSRTPDIFSVKVYNNVGNLVFERNNVPVNGNAKLSINMQTAPSGIYIVTFTSGVNRVVRKMMINN